MGLLKSVLPWAMAGLIATVAGLGLIVEKQRNNLEKSAENIERLEEQIAGLKLSAALTASLREDNAELREERDDLLGELVDAPSYNEVLPSDIRTIIDRMRP